MRPAAARRAPPGAPATRSASAARSANESRPRAEISASRAAVTRGERVEQRGQRREPDRAPAHAIPCGRDLAATSRALCRTSREGVQSCPRATQPAYTRRDAIRPGAGGVLPRARRRQRDGTDVPTARRGRGLLRPALVGRSAAQRDPLPRRARHERIRLRSEERSVPSRPLARALSRRSARRPARHRRGGAPRAASASSTRSAPALDICYALRRRLRRAHRQAGAARARARPPLRPLLRRRARDADAIRGRRALRRQRRARRSPARTPTW